MGAESKFGMKEALAERQMCKVFRGLP